MKGIFYQPSKKAVKHVCFLVLGLRDYSDLLIFGFDAELMRNALSYFTKRPDNLKDVVLEANFTFSGIAAIFFLNGS